MSVKSYGFGDVDVIVASIRMSGFAEDSGVTVSRDSDLYVKTSGIDGKHSRAKQANDGASVTLTLAQTSSDNATLQALALAGTVFPFMVKDNSGTGSAATIIMTSDAWIEKQPDAEFGAEVSNREWMIACGSTTFVEQGN